MITPVLTGVFAGHGETFYCGMWQMAGKRGGVLLLAGLIFAAAIAGCIVLLVRYLHIPHFRTVVDGKIYRSGQPIGSDWTRLHDRYGIRTVVNLRPAEDRDDGDWFAEEQRAVVDCGMTWLNIPMPDRWPSKEQADKVLAVLAEPANHPVLVHCKRGRDRTGIMTVLYRIHIQGWPVQEALDEMRAHRDGDPPAPRIVEFVRNYRFTGQASSRPAASIP